jgi:dTDP-glucose 4,6-dehydratase
MTAPFSARQYEKLREVTHIINVASRCHVGESITHPADFYRNNINLMVELLEWCRDRGPQLQGIIHMSTDEVFGPGGAHQDGYDWHHPSSPYAASKAAQEDLCMAYRTTYGLPITVVNSANMFGERQSMLAFIPRAIVAAATGQMLDIHTYAGQPGSRWYTYVRNVASRLAALLDRERRHYPDRMLLPGQQCMDNLALALAIEELVPGGKVKYRLLNADNIRPGYDPSYPRLQPNNQWAEGLTSFADGLVNTVAWMLADPGRVDTDLDFLP